MARRMRCSDAGYVYHVLNRAVGRATLFEKSADFAAFEKVIRQAWERTEMRLVSLRGRPKKEKEKEKEKEGVDKNLTWPLVCSFQAVCNNGG